MCLTENSKLRQSEEYDFSNGERGKFFRDNTKLILPVYPDDDAEHSVQKQARSTRCGNQPNQLF